MNILFGVENTAVAAEGNPELFEIGQTHDALLEEYNTLNEEITSEEVPEVPAKKEKARYDALAEHVNSLQIRMLEWEARAKQFIGKPSLEFIVRGVSDELEQRHLQAHIVHYVTTLRNDISASRVILVNNFQRVVSEAESNRNFKLAIDSSKLADDSFKIAIKSYKLAIWGLGLAIVGLVASIVFGLVG